MCWFMHAPAPSSPIGIPCMHGPGGRHEIGNLCVLPTPMSVHFKFKRVCAVRFRLSAAQDEKARRTNGSLSESSEAKIFFTETVRAQRHGAKKMGGATRIANPSVT
ncbi:hypothetical protein BDA96_07G154600 [Sorghum bicolor]|uniref:Uncharacterized protein n=1 Tax=Sorghum bicolor TaxID=4558 RepID=A0A921U9V0_SORBI|nr:hypothetical protein BDA96_07G154600 [Sorghum bicolor]